MVRFLLFVTLIAFIAFVGCQIDQDMTLWLTKLATYAKEQNITPLQLAQRDYWEFKEAYAKDRALRKEDGIPSAHRYYELREKHLGISFAVSKLLADIYGSEYKDKFNENHGLSVSGSALYIGYLRIQYTFPDKTEDEWIELYREAVRAGIVRATIDGRYWKWNPEHDELK